MRLTTTPTVVDATETEFRDPLVPTLISELKEHGFRVIGRVATHKPPSGHIDFGYDAAERRRLNVWRARPAATLLVAGDGTAYANVDTFGAAPLIRLRTELRDGSLVETVAVAPEGMLIPRRGLQPPLATTGAGNAPGRSVRVMTLVDTPGVLAAHAQHCTEVRLERGVEPALHEDRAGALRLWQTSAAHTDVCAAWLRKGLGRMTGIVCAVTLVLTTAIALCLLFLWRVQSPVLAVVIVVVLTLVILPVLQLTTVPWRHRFVASTANRPPYPPSLAQPRSEAPSEPGPS